ncbi:MAG: DUF2764 family protein [Chloroflexi bacterium]|nr:DUF2764 family protein [Chloroflexota bacterium]
MAGDNYFLLASLPVLGELGSAPPLMPAQFLERVADAGGNRLLVEAVLLGDDLLQRQAFLAGERQEVEPAVLTLTQIRNEEPLPEYLGVSPQESAVESTIDVLWESYYRYAAALAGRMGSTFLSEWISYEVSLRNALVTARAKALGVEPQAFTVAVDLGEDTARFTGLISEWSVAPDPLAGLRVLDQARWEWLWANDDWFSFGDAEVAAYGAKLMLLQRWNRISGRVAS